MRNNTEAEVCTNNSSCGFVKGHLLFSSAFACASSLLKVICWRRTTSSWLFMWTTRWSCPVLFSFSCSWLFTKWSCLELLCGDLVRDFLCGDLVRDDRTLAAHHLGSAWVVGEGDKVVQVAHLTTRLNLKQTKVKILFYLLSKKEFDRIFKNWPAQGREEDGREVLPSGPSHTPRSCSSASWSCTSPSPSGCKRWGWRARSWHGSPIPGCTQACLGNGMTPPRS